MLFLASINDLLQVVTSGSAEVDVHASWVDNLSGAITPSRTNTAHIASATTTTIVGSPASSTTRNVVSMYLHNSDNSASNTVTIQHTDGTTVETLLKYVLLAGETIMLLENGQWLIIDASGGCKVTPATGLFLKRTIYTSGTNTFTPQAQTHSINVTVVGGGGGGGASGTGNAGNNNAGGGGAAGGNVERKYVISATATYTATVGGGGAGGVAPSNNGTAGTDSTFTDGTTVITAKGGPGGQFGPAIAAAPLVAPGGVATAISTNGDLNGAGAPGGPGMRLAAAVAISGEGGSSPFGAGGGGALNTNGAGAAGVGPGGGGAGGGSNNASGAAGGAGVAGCIIVDEYS